MKKLIKIISDRFKIENINIEKVVMDTKDVTTASLFFAINNGNKYIDKALSLGASLVIADNYNGDDKRVIKVGDTISTMQEIAHEYRKSLDLKIIGITGSNGKTTTKDMIYTLLSSKFKTCKTQGNYNNHIGVPYTIMQCQDDTQILVLEMGMSHFGEIDRLGEISKPNYGVITNIGDSHLEFLKDRAGVAKAKLELAKHVNDLILFGDDYYLKDIAGIHVGAKTNNDFQIKEIKEEDEKTIFKLNDKEYIVPTHGIHNVYNAAMSVVIAKKFDLTDLEINNAFKNLKITSGRFEIIEVADDIYINDAYNASPISTKYSLETFDNLYNDRFKIVCLGDMLELGNDEEKFHKETLQIAKNIKADKIFIYGDIMKKALSLIDNKKNIIHFDTKEEIIREIAKYGKKAILLKGSRGMKMEEIIVGSRK